MECTAAAPLFQSIWEQQQQYPNGNVYMISQTDWSVFANHTHFYGIGNILGAGNFSSGSTPMFAVVGADNVCYYNDYDISEVEAALNLAIESFETIELIADFNVSSTNIYLGDEIQFTDNSIGEPAIWEWDFENDGVYDSSEQHPTHIYNSEGTYSVKLKITKNTTEDILVKEDLVTVESIELIADFNVSSANIYLGEDIQFTDNSIGEPITWEWDFENDGVYDSSEQHPTHIYDSEGTYSVKLKITKNTTEDILVQEDLVTVESIELIADFNVSSANIYLGEDIQFTDNSIGEPITWEWDFENDGVYDSSEQHPTHTYYSEGIYSVKLKVTRNAAEDILIKEDLVTVEIIPPTSPQNVQVQIDYPDVVISWSAVETNILGEPITPDGYIVLYSNEGEDYFNLRYSGETTLFHNDIAANSDQMFYQVVAFISNSGSQLEYLEGLSVSPEKIKWSEVRRNLKKLAKE